MKYRNAREWFLSEITRLMEVGDSEDVIYDMVETVVNSMSDEEVIYENWQHLMEEDGFFDEVEE